MSIRAYYYITGDTQQSGFRRIGGSDSFPADSLPYLNNGEPIQERARVEAGGGSSGAGGGVKTLSHVWEYQTGRYGCPVIINTMAAIGTGRAHAFSEYVAGESDNVAEEADAGRMIAAAESFELLDVEQFMAIPGWEKVDCPEAVDWDPMFAPAGSEGNPIETGDEWRKTVLAHYWKQASIRAFSEDPPASVRVNLGEFHDDQSEDTEATIREAKRFFSSVIVPGLPRQVQNIASMAAGVHCADECSLYTAIEFDITRNMFADETLCIDKPGKLESYRLSEGELDFITEVSGGRTPEVVRKFFDRYRELTGNQDLKETAVPFMADYRVWYDLYCADGIIRDGHEFIRKAQLTKEHGNPNEISDARACFLLMQRLRRTLEKEHGLNTGSRRTLVSELMEELENGLLQVMLEDMNAPGARAFMMRKNEMLDFHRRTLYTATEEQLEPMIALAVRDAVVSQAPQFVRCYPSTPINNEQADVRNGKLISALLPAAITPLIESEIKGNREKLENKYVRALAADDGFRTWALQHNETNKAVCEYIRNEIRDADKHFLIYGLSKKYLPANELLLVTLNHMKERNSARNNRPGERQMAIAMDGAADYITGTQVDANCVEAMNRYYLACFREYRAGIGSISEEIIQKLGGDTTGAMTMIFDEYARGERINAEEAEAVFTTFGGENGRLIRDQVITSYTGMLTAQRETALSDPAADRRPLIQWLNSMVGAAPFDIDISEDMIALFNHAANGERMTPEEAESIFGMPDKEHRYARREGVITAYTRMISAGRAGTLKDPEADRRPLIRWIGSMISTAPFDIDSSDDMAALFTHAANGERMTSEEAENVFTILDSEGRCAQKENVVSAYSRMIAAHQAKILEDPDTDREAARESMVRWVAGMVEKAPFRVDTSDSIKAAFESARKGDRMSRATAQQIFDKLMKNASAGEEKVKAAFQNMIRDQLDAALAKEEKDVGVLEWIGSMIVVAGDHIEYDTTDVLKKIFESARTGERMRPSDAGYVFDSMGSKADGLNTVVQRVYSEMLTLRRKEIIENADPDGFSWLCDMADRAPWRNDTAWRDEQHTDNVAVLCEISRNTDSPIDTNSLNTVRIWLERGELTPQGVTRLQKYCNSQLEKGETAAVDAMAPFFGVIDGSCEALRSLMFDSALTAFRDGLGKPDVSFAELIRECSGNVERAGRRLDELYKAAETETEEFLTRYFEENSDLGGLSREMEQIPRNSYFYSRWQEHLSRKGLTQQEDLFNGQPNLEKLIALKSELMSRSGKLMPSLTAAYKLIESFEGRFEKLKEKTEYEVIASAGGELKEVRDLLKQAAPVRRTLCSSLRNEKYPVQEELKDRSFRHAFCSAAMQAMLTDTEREVADRESGAKVGGCPDWTKVLNSFFPKAELDDAIRKPYDRKNLPVLQRLLSMVDTARIMTVYGLEPAWEADLERTIHSHSDLHSYQSALARNRKKSELYRLQFDTDGLVFQS